MSVPTQTSAPGELPGGSKFVDERRGNEASQTFPLTGAGARTTQVDADQPAQLSKPNLENGAASRPSGDVSGMNAGNGRAITVKPVDSRTITGSTPGDHRIPAKDGATAAIAKAADNGGVRAPAGQFANNGKTPQTSGFQSYPVPDSGD